MGDINYEEMFQQARKIDTMLSQLFKRLTDPKSLGEGNKGRIRLDDLERTLSSHEEALAAVHNTMYQKLVEIKEFNNQKLETLNDIKAEVSKIEDSGKNYGVIVPISDMSRLTFDDVSPDHMSYAVTPLSSHRNRGHHLHPRSTPGDMFQM